jgi:hypothetical protein
MGRYVDDKINGIINGMHIEESENLKKSKTITIELDFTYTPNEEDVYVYLKELMKDRNLSWEIEDE